MSRSLPLILAISLAWLAPALTAAAADPDPAPAPEPIALSGFVDTSVVVPLTGYPAGSRGVSLGLDQVELDVVAKPIAGVTVRADLNWFPAAPVLLFDNIVEQGFVRADFAGGLYLLAGKVNAPIGVELQDPTDKFQFSNGLLFDYATPSNLTGFFAGLDSGGLHAELFVSNDWDTPNTPKNASGGARVAYGFGAGSLIGLSAMYGPFDSDDARFLVDLDVTLGLGALTLWFEGNFNRTPDVQAVGVMAKANYAFDDQGLTLRLSYLDSDDAIGDFGRNDLEVTGAWFFPVIEHVIAIFELRADVPEAGDARLIGAFGLTGDF